MLFEVAILEHPHKKAKEDGSSERLVYGPKFVIAQDAQMAGHKVVMEIGGLPANERPIFDIERAEVLIRPFA